MSTIRLYTAPTPNGRKISIMLEELGVPYAVHAVNLDKGEQFEPDFLRISPNNKIPAIVEEDTGMSIMESGAILMHLADRFGQFFPRAEPQRIQVEQWLMWQVSGLGPMLGQAHQYLKYNPGKAPFAEERMRREVKRLYGVLDTRLAGREYVVDDYSIADIAIWPWVSRFEWHQVDLDAFPNVRRWYLQIADRPAVQRGYHVPHRVQDIPRP